MGIAWPEFGSQISFIEFLETIFQQESSAKIAHRYMALWAIWNHRNMWLHEGIKEDADKLYIFITIYSQESLANMHNRMDESSVNQHVLWCPPKEGQVKLNFDASFDITTGRVGIDVIAMDSTRNCIGGKMENVENVLDAYTAEALACRTSFSFAHERVFSNIVIEGDNLNVIIRLQLEEEDKSLSGRLTQDCKVLSTLFAKVRYKNINRMSNQVADSLANRAKRMEMSCCWFEEPSDWVMDLLRDN